MQRCMQGPPARAARRREDQMNQSEEELRERLGQVEESLARLRADLPAPPADAGDFVDSGQYLAQREELEGQIEVLENERERLRDSLGLR